MHSDSPRANSDLPVLPWWALNQLSVEPIKTHLENLIALSTMATSWEEKKSALKVGNDEGAHSIAAANFRKASCIGVLAWSLSDDFVLFEGRAASLSNRVHFLHSSWWQR